MGLKFRREIWAGDTDLENISIWKVTKIMAMKDHPGRRYRERRDLGERS